MQPGDIPGGSPLVGVEPSLGNLQPEAGSGDQLPFLPASALEIVSYPRAGGRPGSLCTGSGLCPEA